MKIWLALVAALALVYGDDKPGDCPNATVVISLETCTDDFDCSGTNKCCGSVCTPPVCNDDDDDDDDDDNVQCLVNPCESATCSAVPDAVCFEKPCSDSCEPVWLTSTDDVTEKCLNDDDDNDDDLDEKSESEVDADDGETDVDDEDDSDDDDKKMTKKDKKANHKAKNVAWLKKMWAEKAEVMEAKRDAKIANWETMGKQDKVDKFTKKWDRNNTSFEGKRKGKWGKKANLSHGKHQKKQQWKEMTPEERFAEKMARKPESRHILREQRRRRQRSGTRRWESTVEDRKR